MSNQLVIGLDFGTDSVRALVVNAGTGEEISSAVHYYTRWQQKLYCDPSASRFRQHPLDYIEGMEQSIRQAVAVLLTEQRAQIAGISIDTTGSTPAPINRQGLPLALLPAFADNPNAMFVLWKDHTAQQEADEINALAHAWKTDYTKYSGGLYSPEWFWAKLLHILRTDEAVREEAFTWAEHCDWLPALLTGNNDPLAWKRSRCAAGHKAMWHETFAGLPAEDFLQALDPLLTGLRERLYEETYTADQCAGIIALEWAERLGLPADVKIGVGSLDAHAGATGACIEPYTLVKVTGTSTCDMTIVPYETYKDKLVNGICGQVNGSIIPGMLGMEAGQSAFGDVYQWFSQLLSFPLRTVATDYLSQQQIEAIEKNILQALNDKAAVLPVMATDPVALDWINGRRTPDADLSVKGAITGLQLGTGGAAIFKALVEATAFGAKAIVQRFEEEGISIRRIVAIGGISKKSPFVMQVLSNVLDRPIAIVRSEQACALGAAMYAATACGIYKSIEAAQRQMGSGFETEYLPEKDKVAVYEQLFRRYLALGQFVAEKPGLFFDNIV